MPLLVVKIFPLRKVQVENLLSLMSDILLSLISMEAVWGP